MKIPKQKFKLGDKVIVKWKSKHYDKKSVRRKVMDSIIEKCIGLPITNLANGIVGQRYMLELDSYKEYTQLVNDFMEGRRKALPKIYDEKRDWIRAISKAIDNFQYAIVIGVQYQMHHLSDFCPCHISYCKDNGFFKYTVMIVGENEKGNSIAFECDLLDCDFKKCNAVIN